MTIEQRNVGSAVVLDLHGKLVLGDGSGMLKDKVHSLVFQGQKQIVLNLGDVGYMDSAGLGELVQAYSTVSKSGGALKLVSPTKRLKDLLVITKLSTVFDSFDDEAEAVASYNK